jgi:membrane associated rhomboid family serine protease
LGDAPPTVYLIIIAATALTSMAGLSQPNIIRNHAIMPWIVVREGRWLQMFTSGFLHANFGHLFFNMFTLFFFGSYMESVLGAPRFLVLYLGSLFFGSLGTLVFHRDDPTYRAIGASGAVSGVIFGFVLLRPLAPIYLFLLPIGIPAILFGIGYTALSIYGARRGLGQIGHAAHLGGAVGGIILTMILYPDALRIFLSHFR